MASSLAFFTIFSLLLDEPMPKAIQGLLPEDQSSSLLSKKPNCQTIPGATNGEEKSFVKDLEAKTNVSAYRDKVTTKEEKEKPFVGDFEPRPNVSAYNE
ncbi:hypothetical protein CK203_010684 [Vitis vinifera]|uniref:Organ-specific protein S2 n=1 Tax=Vitis vinifera TaxID=29760 RepID=A0A438JTE7_VITVI|nr:hypothetical protein CK203_010684 [Vitis vinifera]